MVPHLRTALTGPLSELEIKMLDAMPQIERWFRMEWQEHTPPFYSSVNLRHSGFKLAPVNTNLFPDGFNYLAEEMYPLATQAAMAAVEKYCPDAKNLLIISSNQTNCPLYLKNLAHLSNILRLTGLNVRLGSLSESLTQPETLSLPDGQTISLEPLERNGRRITLDKGRFDPCTILLNNDLLSGTPKILENLTEQILLPPLHAGWGTHRQSTHFENYDSVIKRFSKSLDIDHWLISTYNNKLSNVDCNQASNNKELLHLIDQQLKKIAKKYKEYGIKEKPFLIIKPDVGTSKPIIKIHNSKELAELDHWSHEKNTNKNGLTTNNILIQEGIPTIEKILEQPAEPIVYMIDRYVIGGFYRIFSKENINETRHESSIRFESLPYIKQSERTIDDISTVHNRFYSYGVVARLAMLASSLELEQTNPNPDFF